MKTAAKVFETFAAVFISVCINAKGFRPYRAIKAKAASVLSNHLIRSRHTVAHYAQDVDSAREL